MEKFHNCIIDGTPTILQCILNWALAVVCQNSPILVSTFALVVYIAASFLFA